MLKALHVGICVVKQHEWFYLFNSVNCSSVVPIGLLYEVSLFDKFRQKLSDVFLMGSEQCIAPQLPFK